MKEKQDRAKREKERQREREKMEMELYGTINPNASDKLGSLSSKSRDISKEVNELYSSSSSTFNRSGFDHNAEMGVSQDGRVLEEKRGLGGGVINNISNNITNNNANNNTNIN